ncbi:MAG: DUF423 domain-containing protein [Terrimicrobiaceae bacterium]|nr:DUF423 domain-containing protein [Terrimicrobiaceae bacterium]
MPISQTLAMRIAAALGFTGVIFGALGAHSLKPALASFGTASTWETGVLYQLVHAVALLALAAAGRATALVTALWTAGVVIFSGTLYVISLSEFKILGAVTPVGGLLVLTGWLALLIRGR